MLHTPLLPRFLGALRRRQLHHDYVARREYYWHRAQEQRIIYDEDEVVKAVRARLARRGYSPAMRALGEIHTFAFIPRIGWHAVLYKDLAELGPVTAFDYVAAGYHADEFLRYDRRAAQRRRDMNALVLPALREAHLRRPVDWVFVYASGLEVKTELIRAIVDEFGIPVVNMCLDDKQSWEGPAFDGQRTGQVDSASVYDLSWTSARVACEWYLVEGGRPLYMPEGFDVTTYRPMTVDRDIPVSFIGGAYGFRPSVVQYLRRYGIPIQTFGTGWGTRSIWGDEAVAVMNRSCINLSMGGIGYSEALTNVKTRDFEIPGTGGGVYLTSFNPDLAQHFEVGREILCYRNRNEMVELIRYYLSHPEQAREIAMRGRARCLADHRWLYRYRHVCQVLGILPDHGAQIGKAGRDGTADASAAAR